MVNVTPTASLLEVIYTLLAVFGVCVMVYTAIDCWLDSAAVKHRGSSRVARDTARIGIRESVAGAMCHAVFTYLGLLALATPPPPTLARQVLADQYALGFILIQATIIGFRAWNQVARVRIRRYLRSLVPRDSQGQLGQSGSVSSMSEDSAPRRSIQHYGWRPSLPDHRDEYAVLDLVAAADVISLRGSMPPVYDQSQLGSCVWHSTSCLIQVTEAKEGEANPMPSRLFGYYLSRLLDGSPLDADTGTEVRTAFKVLHQFGWCPETDWPYDIEKFADRPPQQCFDDAKKELAKRYRRVMQWDRALGAALAQGYPIAFGFTVYESFESDEVARTGVVPMPGPDERQLGGHSPAIVGRDFSRKRFPVRMYEVRNSWSKTWGDGGYCWMPATYIESSALSSDFWILQAI